MILFKREDVKRYFSILEKLGRVTENRYMGYDVKNPHIALCQKEVFVKRTLSKWFKGKDFIWYDINDSGIEFLNYIHIASIRYHLGYSDEIDVTFLSYNRNYQWEDRKISYNDVLELEGELSENNENHKKVLELTSTLNLTPKEYVYQTYDWSLYPKKVKDEALAKAKIMSTHSFYDRTQRGITKQLKEFRQNSKIMIGELLEIKNIEN